MFPYILLAALDAAAMSVAKSPVMGVVLFSSGPLGGNRDMTREANSEFFDDISLTLFDSEIESKDVRIELLIARDSEKLGVGAEEEKREVEEEVDEEGEEEEEGAEVGASRAIAM